MPGAVLHGWTKPGEDARTATASLHHVHHRQHVEAWVVGEIITTPSGGQPCRGPRSAWLHRRRCA